MDARLRLGPVTLGERPVVVAAGGEGEIDALSTATAADAVELRADLFADPQPAAVAAILGRLRATGRPVILTVRAASEGGQPLDDGRRRALYEAGLPHADAIDLEIASTALVMDVLPRARAARRLVILSAHALDGTPATSVLHDLVTLGFARGADVVKLATHARDPDDLRTLLEVTLAARARHRHPGHGPSGGAVVAPRATGRGVAPHLRSRRPRNGAGTARGGRTGGARTALLPLTATRPLSPAGARPWSRCARA